MWFCLLATICWLLTIFWLAGGYSQIVALASKPNELGDFLAGAFAPVAFGWLVAAVILQAQELRAQRQELIHTVVELSRQSSLMEKNFSLQKAVADAAQLERSFDLFAEQVANAAPQAFVAILEHYDPDKEYETEHEQELDLEDQVARAEKGYLLGKGDELVKLINSHASDAAIRYAAQSLGEAYTNLLPHRREELHLNSGMEFDFLADQADRIFQQGHRLQDEGVIVRFILGGLLGFRMNIAQIKRLLRDYG